VEDAFLVDIILREEGLVYARNPGRNDIGSVPIVTLKTLRGQTSSQKESQGRMRDVQVDDDIVRLWHFSALLVAAQIIQLPYSIHRH
jgi:hypothetical protein